MEEILASIKRVIADDGRGQTRGPRRPQAAPDPEPEAPPSPEEDVLELSDPVSEENGLLSQGAAAASRQSLAALAALREGSGSAQQAASTAPAGSPLEEAVKDMLRPMLKDWLDQHLPDIVEELVTREIARITGKPL